LIGDKKNVQRKRIESEERVLKMKLKPIKAKETFEDQPRYKKGPNWREKLKRKPARK